MATSYNGWPASQDPNAIGIDKNFKGGGVKFPGGIKSGDVATVLGYVADQLASRVEKPTVNPDGTGYGCWGYNYRANVNNPSTLSCHSSGTAIDWIAPSHPNGASGTFSSSQVKTIRAILSECQGAVYWGGDFSGTKDEMHFEITVSASKLAPIAASLRGSTPPNPTPGPDPEPKPEEEDEDMYHTYQSTSGPESGGIWIAGPGFMEVIPTQEYYDTLVKSGAAKPVVKVSARELDVLQDSYRRFSMVRNPLKSLVNGGDTNIETAVLWADKNSYDAANLEDADA